MIAPAYPLPDLSELASALKGREDRLALGGVVPPARALVLAALAQHAAFDDGAVVIQAHEKEVEETAALLQILAPELRVAVAPGGLASIYQGAEAPLYERMQALRCLAQIAANDFDLLLVPARALLAPIPRPESLASSLIRISTGDELDVRDFGRRLVEAGYRRVDLVEEAGDFAFRGWVLDVHPGGEEALRLELDDQRVEMIRRFDPSTQRSEGDVLDDVEILPMDPFPRKRELEEKLAGTLGADYPALASAIREGIERRLWWGLQHMVAEDSCSWLDLGAPLLVCDLEEVIGEVKRWWVVQNREWETLKSRDVHLPGPELGLEDPELLAGRLEGCGLRIEALELRDEQTRWWRVKTHFADSFVRKIPDLVPALREKRAEDFAQVLVVATRSEEGRFRALLEKGDILPVDPPPAPGRVSILRGRVQEGFVWEGGLAVYGRRKLTAAPRPRPKRKGVGAFVSDLRDLRPGHLVVHMDHGIGKFTGFRRTTIDGRLMEMLVLEYQKGDTLLVPVERADLIQKFSSGEGETPARLDRLGGATWKRKKARVRKAVKEMAAELLRLAAVRRSARGQACPADSPWQREFEDAFAWELTSDQSGAVAEIKFDMESTGPMDRLLCGDVGFGKTEVAIRAAFKAVLGGRQVAVLAPTTILVDQHMKTFRERMEGFPVEIRMLSRFTRPPDAKQTLRELAEGRVDIVIGTHRLLSPSVAFRDLGLVIIDEEQRFGVAQKERLKALRTEVDVLSMSATPIPRTLNMAFSGLRDISLIESPPRDRQAVETTVLEFSEDVVREAVLHEIERGGQVFFVHNRVRSIGAFAEWLRTTVPEARVVVGHGQMSERALEKAMNTFLSGEADVLLATSIIENGIDIPSANTLLVNRADRFGLAQLYQLRGRVGRSDRLAYAYFLVPPSQPLSTTARARLQALQEFCELGSGFRIAARDLEIRGAGNMLGAEQHGFMEAVGFETYCQLLEEAVAELEGQSIPSRRPVELHLGMDLQLPEEYIPEAALRLSFYKRLTACENEASLSDLLEEIVDRYGPSPPQLENLAMAQRIRTAAVRAGMSRIERRGGKWRLFLDPSGSPPENLAEVLGDLEKVRVMPTGEISISDAAFGLRELLETLGRLLC